MICSARVALMFDRLSDESHPSGGAWMISGKIGLNIN